jgi:hypothetical protein
MGATASAISAFFSAGTGVAGTAATAAGVAGAAVAADVAGDLLAPNVPKLAPPAAMPDPLETQKAKERSIIEQMARRGRAASILTSEGSGTKLGG